MAFRCPWFCNPGGPGVILYGATWDCESRGWGQTHQQAELTWEGSFFAKGGEWEERGEKRERERNRETEIDRDRDRDSATSEKLLHRKKRAGVGGVLPAMCAWVATLPLPGPQGAGLGLRLPGWSHPGSCFFHQHPRSSTFPVHHVTPVTPTPKPQFTRHPATPSTLPLTTLFCTLQFVWSFPLTW